MNWMSTFKIMPLLVVVAALSFGVRFGEFMTGVSSMPGNANAQMATDANKDDDAKPMMEVAEGGLPAPPPIGEDGPRTASAADTKTQQDWRDSGDSDFEFSPVRMKLFEDLSARRKDLEDQKREMAVREALLKAAEKEIDQKYKELLSLRSEIQELLVQQSEEEKSRVASLVKIYEGMKPKDAARIFNTLDRDVLLQVVSRMSERKSAPVIASMDPDRARILTMMLIEQKSLPDMSAGLL